MKWGLENTEEITSD